MKGLQRANSAVNLVAKVRVQGDRIIREVEAQDQKVEKYVAAVRRYCRGEDTGEHPLWTGLLAELSQKWEVPPRPYGEKSGAYLEDMASSANRRVDAAGLVQVDDLGHHGALRRRPRRLRSGID